MHLIRTPYRLASGTLGRSATLDELTSDLTTQANPWKLGWSWAKADQWDSRWFPQGVALEPNGGALIAVTWYSTGDEGSRITFIDRHTGRYRHVLLIQERRDGVGPVKTHAGGLIWVGNELHIASTKRGLLSFDLTGLRYADHSYLLPLSAAHRPEAPDLRFSFISHDSAGLLVGEYARGSTARLVRYRSEAGQSLAFADPVVIGEGVDQMQGAVEVDGTFYLTVSHGRWGPGDFVIGRPGAWQRHRFQTPPGPEDLDYDPATDALWTLTEHPGMRRLFPTPRVKRRFHETFGN